jgi:nitrate reductase / nitrite oxidoreductase, alpha subunit
LSLKYKKGKVVSISVLKKRKYLKAKDESFAGGFGTTKTGDRSWEEKYGQRWQHDRVVRSTHGVNCTGSCSWKIYVKSALVIWETQNTDYPKTRPDMPDHEPRGCARGASYSWYLYSANRVKFPLVRKRLLMLWREAKAEYKDPVEAWESIVSNPEKSKHYKEIRGKGGFVRGVWKDMNEIIAAANIYTAKKYGPDRVIGFSPIPAMSMASYAAGSRYLSLMGGVCMSFYDWYCDLPPTSPQTWGEQTDVPESADWYNSSFLMVWGSNVPLTRTPDAHFLTEVRYKGTKTVVVSPDYNEAAKFADHWLHPKQGTDAAVGLAMGHVVLKEHYVENKSSYFNKYCKRYTDMPFLITLKKKGDSFVPETFVRASDFSDNLNVENNPEWKPVFFDENSLKVVVPNGTIGARWGEKGKWNLNAQDQTNGEEVDPLLSLIDKKDEVVSVSFPYFGNQEHEHGYFEHTKHESIINRNVPVRLLKLEKGDTYVATVHDLMIANYGIDRGLGGGNVASSYEDDEPYTPKWQEKITGVPAQEIITLARQFADTADKTQGKSMIIVGAGINHWYNSDMIYRSIINLLVMCGCVGKSGGGWAHYVGQEKLRPQAGWLPVAFGLDWSRPPRQMNSTSFFYAHTNQWRYETTKINEILSPLADEEEWKDISMIDCNIRAEKMGWLPSAPQLEENPLKICRDAQSEGKDIQESVLEDLKSKKLRFSCEDPDNPKNFPRNLFVWRANLLGSSSKGHEYFLKYLLGTQHGLKEKDLGNDSSAKKPKEAVWREENSDGKLDLLVTLDFRMSTSCVYSDIVLPTATWYEKNDLSTTDMHPFIHPLSKAVDPKWESKSDWDIFKGLSEKFSELVPGHLGVEKDVVLVPILHDTPKELAQDRSVKDWSKGECPAIPGKTMPNIVVVERDYPNLYKKFSALGPLMNKLGNGTKGLSWNCDDEIESLKNMNQIVKEEGVSKGMPQIGEDIQALETILTLAPETNGEVAVKAWKSLEEVTGLSLQHLALPKEDEKIHFKDLKSQPKKIITSPTWSGIDSEKVSYTGNYTNVHEFIPWRTLTGRQQLYQDHSWLRAFGESLCVYKPPINTKTIAPMLENKSSSTEKKIALNFIHAHQKWAIHSTFSDNLIMLTLGRGGPNIWISEIDAKKIDVEDNDWIEAYNSNGSLSARAVVSQRVPEGMSLMYHAQEKIINTPKSETSGVRSGIHNSITRISLKPTHMIGGYAQLAYGFNYYGTVGSNRDEFVIIKKMKKVEWMEEELGK